MRKRINALVRDKQIIVHHPFILSKCILYSLLEFSNRFVVDIRNIDLSVIMLKLVK